MDPYKPQYLGKVMPENPPELTAFMQKNFEQFSKSFDVCKDSSADISDISNVSPGKDKFVVKVSASDETMSKLADAVANGNDKSVTITGNEITVKPDDQDQ